MSNLSALDRFRVKRGNSSVRSTDEAAPRAQPQRLALAVRESEAERVSMVRDTAVDVVAKLFTVHFRKEAVKKCVRGGDCSRQNGTLSPR